MQYYVKAGAPLMGYGTKDCPFSTIQAAADVARPGDTVLVAPGIYREYVDPKCGGTDDDHRITYISEEPLGAVISGAEVIKGWKQYDGNVYTVKLPNGMFGSYNPYKEVIHGDWYRAVTPAHGGEVYLNGKSLYEVFTLEDVLSPTVYKPSWDQAFTIYVWYTEQTDDDCTVLYANFQGADPNTENVEINVRRNCFYPSVTGKGYITLRGFNVTKAATTWAPPTAYQEGMIGPHWSKGWIIEDCEVSDSKCSGISLGKYLQPNNENKWTTKLYKHGTQTERDAILQANLEGWNKENIGSHIIRRCNIHDCGQTGIVGHLGGVFSIIEDNHIHHINNKQNLAGAEIGGIKMHAAIDVIYRRNHIHHCTRGLWLDWQAQGTRVTQNFFHHNTPPVGVDMEAGLALGEDIFIEVSHGPTLVDNNLLLSQYSGRLATQGMAFVHNLIGGSFSSVGHGHLNGNADEKSLRYTPYHAPHGTDTLGFMTILHGDARFYNNIFVQQEPNESIREYVDRTEQDTYTGYNTICGTKPYDGYLTAEEYFGAFNMGTALARQIYYNSLPIYTGGNVYFNGAQPCDKEVNYTISDEKVTFEVVEENGTYSLKTNLFDHMPDVENPIINTEILGEAFEPEQLFENPDGTPIIFDADYFGRKRVGFPMAGPFVCGSELKDLKA